MRTQLASGLTVRGRLLRVHACLAVLAVGLAIMAIVPLRLALQGGRSASEDQRSDSDAVQDVERGLRRLTDACRTFAVTGDDLQRVRIARIQREIEPALDMLVARAEAMNSPNARQLDADTDRYLGWLAQGVTERITLAAFETSLAMWSPTVQLQLDAFQHEARERSLERLAQVERLGSRAQLGILIIAFLALVIGASAMASLLRRFNTISRP